MPDLGKYAAEVLAAYGVSLLAIIAVVGLSVWQSRRMKARLAAAEARSQ